MTTSGTAKYYGTHTAAGALMASPRRKELVGIEPFKRYFLEQGAKPGTIIVMGPRTRVSIISKMPMISEPLFLDAELPGATGDCENEQRVRMLFAKVTVRAGDAEYSGDALFSETAMGLPQMQIIMRELIGVTCPVKFSLDGKAVERERREIHVIRAGSNAYLRDNDTAIVHPDPKVGDIQISTHNLTGWPNLWEHIMGSPYGAENTWKQHTFWKQFTSLGPQFREIRTRRGSVACSDADLALRRSMREAARMLTEDGQVRVRVETGGFYSKLYLYSEEGPRGDLFQNFRIGVRASDMENVMGDIVAAEMNAMEGTPFTRFGALGVNVGALPGPGYPHKHFHSESERVVIGQQDSILIACAASLMLHAKNP